MILLHLDVYDLAIKSNPSYPKVQLRDYHFDEVLLTLTVNQGQKWGELSKAPKVQSLRRHSLSELCKSLSHHSLRSGLIALPQPSPPSFHAADCARSDLPKTRGFPVAIRHSVGLKQNTASFI